MPTKASPVSSAGFGLFTLLFKLLLIFLTSQFFLNSEWFRYLSSDLSVWTDFLTKCRMGLIPYVDFTREYPVGAGALYWMLSWFWNPASGLNHFIFIHAVAMAFFDSINAVLFFLILEKLRVKPRERILWTIIFVCLPTALFLTPFRFESTVLLFVLWGYLKYLENQFFQAVFLWSLGAQIKWFPFVIVAALVLQKGQKLLALRLIGLCLGVTLACNLPFLILCYLKNGNGWNFFSTYFYHVHRPLYWDTVLGAAELWFGPISWERWASLWSGAAMVVLFFYKPRLRFEFKVASVLMVAFVLNRIYSTQFNLWFYPFLIFGLLSLPVQSAGRVRLVTCFVCLELLNILVYPFGFAASLNEMHEFLPLIALHKGGAGTVIFSGAIALRALILVGMFLLMLRKDQVSVRS